MGISVLSFDRLKIHSAMLAQRADDIFRKFIAFIDVSADFAYPAFFALGLWLWLYMFLVVGVSHGILIAHDTGLCDAADEHPVSAEIHIVFYLQGHESIDITYRYAHLFPTRQAEMADKLDMERKGA